MPAKVTEKTVAYVGDFQFPNGDAGAHRVLNIGKCLREAGFSVNYFGSEVAGREQDRTPDGKHAYQGFDYTSAGNAGKSLACKFWRLWHTHLSGLSTMARLKSAKLPEIVIAYQASASLLAQLRRFCSRNGIVLVSDCVEWFDPSHVPGGRFGPMALDSEMRMRWMLPKLDGMVAISSYLEQHYRRVGLADVLRVPALVDLDEPHWKFAAPPPVQGRDTLRLAFVGNAGKKDLLDSALRGLALMGEAGRRIEIAIAGPSRTQVEMSLGADASLLEGLAPQLHFAGRLPHQKALELLASADFSILLRPNARFAQAGFPTKLGESLALGVPIIGNLTGDIGLYVRDGFEGVLVEDWSPEAFAQGLRKALLLTAEEKQAMRTCARQRAERSLDCQNWMKPIGDFMNQLTLRKGIHAR